MIAPLVTRDENTQKKIEINIEINIRICEISRKTRRGKIQETVRRLFDATSVVSY